MPRELSCIQYLLAITSIISANYVLAEVQISTDVIDVQYPLINDNISSGKTLNKNQIVHGTIDSSDAGSLLNYLVGTDNGILSMLYPCFLRLCIIAESL